MRKSGKDVLLRAERRQGQKLQQLFDNAGFKRINVRSHF